MRVTEELVYEYWDCTHCDAAAIRGDKESCETCGHPRAEGITFYRLEDREEVVREAAHQARFGVGQDWVCAFCTALNAANEGHCRGCGASLAESEKKYFDTQQPAQAPASKPGFLKRMGCSARTVVMLGLILLMGGLALDAWYGSLVHPVSYEVTAMSWERAIPTLRYQWVQAVDWEDQIQGDDVKRLSSEKKIRRYEKRQVGTRTERYTERERYQSGTREECSTSYSSTGSGASKKVTTCKDVPVYKTRNVKKTRTVPVYKDFPIHDTQVTYRAKRYKKHRTAKLSGDDNNPKWPQPELGKGVDGKGDRPGKRTEHLTVTLEKRDEREGPQHLTLTAQEVAFRGLEVGGTVEIGVENSGEVHPPQGLVPAGE